MRVAFVTSGLEAGRDGVGDYCRLLAGELLRQGHEVALLAMNDSFVGAEMSEPEYGISTLRLPREGAWPARVERARVFLDRFSPEWISLQFVAYGWQRKGLITTLERPLHRLLAGRRLHVNFHEIWIGAHLRASRKDRVVGFLQRWGLVRLVRKLAPGLITTTNVVYKALLQRQGFAIHQIPLFGNIPVLPVPGKQPPWISTPHDQVWLFGFFGTIHPGWDPMPLVSALINLKAKSALDICVVSFGNLGGGSEPWERLVFAGEGEIKFVRLGEKSPSEVSEILHHLDAGLSSMPWQLMEKSGAAAAMIEHGLPVIVSREEGYGLGAAERPDEPMMLWADEKLPDRLRRRTGLSAGASRLPRVAQLFLELLRRRA